MIYFFCEVGLSPQSAPVGGKRGEFTASELTTARGLVIRRMTSVYQAQLDSPIETWAN